MEIFGFTLNKKQKDSVSDKNTTDPKQNFATPASDDGVYEVFQSAGTGMGGLHQYYMNFDGSFASDGELINKYRGMAQDPVIEEAVDDIVNELVSPGEDGKASVSLNLDDLSKPTSEATKKKIREEFDNILTMMRFTRKCHDIMRLWYIDGRYAIHKIIDEKKRSEGIKELRTLDSRCVRKIRNITKDRGPEGVEVIKKIEEFYLYNENLAKNKTNNNVAGMGSTAIEGGIKIHKDAVAYGTSGLVDTETSVVISHLHKAIKPYNQLRMMEDAVVIYRISRAPERRVFYIDTGNLPKGKSEEYVKKIMNNYKNKITYDVTTGEVKDNKRFMSMLEDFWMPRKEGGRGTEIDTLGGGQTLGEIDDILYFLKRLYKSLKIPSTRLEEGNAFSLGRPSEVTRDELRFSKFIDRLRNRFNLIFDDLLKTQLILKNIIEEDEWDAISEKIQYAYSRDNFFTELKEAEILSERLNLLSTIESYIIKDDPDQMDLQMFTKDWVYKNILRMSEEQIEEMMKKSKEENEEADEEASFDATIDDFAQGGDGDPETEEEQV